MTRIVCNFTYPTPTKIARQENLLFHSDPNKIAKMETKIRHSQKAKIVMKLEDSSWVHRDSLLIHITYPFCKLAHLAQLDRGHFKRFFEHMNLKNHESNRSGTSP